MHDLGNDNYGAIITLEFNMTILNGQIYFQNFYQTM